MKKIEMEEQFQIIKTNEENRNGGTIPIEL